MKNYKENKERIIDIVEIYNRLTDTFKHKNVRVECGLKNPLVDTGWIKLTGKEIVFDIDDIELLVNAGMVASLTDASSNITGDLSLTFTFHGIVDPIDGIPEIYRELFEWAAVRKAINQLNTVPLPNEMDSETVGMYLHAVESIVDDNDGWDVRVDAIDEENLKISFRCQYIEMVYSEDYYYYLVSNSKSSGIRYVNCDEMEIFFVFGNK